MSNHRPCEVERRGHLVTKGDLMKAVWPDTIVEEANLTVTVSELCKALGCSPEQSICYDPAMRRNPKDIATEALALDPKARANLAKRLLESLETLSQQESDELWADEAERRYLEFKKGRAKAVSGHDVFARARARKR